MPTTSNVVPQMIDATQLDHQRSKKIIHPNQLYQHQKGIFPMIQYVVLPNGTYIDPDSVNYIWFSGQVGKQDFRIDIVTKSDDWIEFHFETLQAAESAANSIANSCHASILMD